MRTPIKKITLKNMNPSSPQSSPLRGEEETPSWRRVLHNSSLRGVLTTKQSRDPGSTRAGHEGKGKITHTPSGHV